MGLSKSHSTNYIAGCSKSKANLILITTLLLTSIGLLTAFTWLLVKMDDEKPSLPPGFVYLSDIDPTIIQSIMYRSTENFIGERITGYLAPRAILTVEAAVALHLVQNRVAQDNYSVVLYDSYRPDKAVKHFLKWKDDLEDQRMKQGYYPYIDKKDIFEQGE